MDKLKSLYIDCAAWHEPITVDDFLITIGKRQSNSVYHVAEVRAKPNPKKRLVRYYVKVYISDLITALKKEPHQKIIPMTWYSRDKKKPHA